ncbi:MAG TPA: glycerol kinase GlpK [Polyangiaceae bacterium]|jgi:glycerol kinase|nr:glycerol kinase GlpK [Polyangiaceae bacterium]
MASVLLAIDQGTTGTTSLVVEVGGGAGAAGGVHSRTLGRGYAEFPQHFPQPGWVSHDVREIWASVEASVRAALAQAGLRGDAVVAIGITNQRETTVVWDRRSREPIDLAIVWQCRRTSPVCDELKKDPAVVARVRRKTGLVIDAYFSATKIAWLLDHVATARERAERGELAFGTIDCFLVDRLTGGAVHATDVTNASRTLLMDLEQGQWDPDLARLFRVPTAVLPAIVGNAEIVGKTRGVSFLPDGIPIAGMAGDQQAALFGQACFSEGDAKCTYGTGAFALMNIGEKPILSEHGLVTTAAWRIGGKAIYALEGSAFIAGAAVQWLRDGLGLLASAKDVEALASRVASSEGVVFVPALSGLGAPYWDPEARGTITGITRGTTAAHLARATLEGIAYQVNDLLVAMARDAKRNLARLRVDGGAAANDLLMQFQADVANVVVERPSDVESTARGAAMLAAIGAGLYRGTDEAAGLSPISSRFVPAMPEALREQHLSQWARAVGRTRSAR